MAEDKLLKFSFVVDDASIQKARASIRDLISDFSKFVELSNRMNGGAGAAAGAGVSFGAKSAGPGSAPTQRMIAQAPPMAKGLVANISQHRDFFKGLADGSRNSFRLMTEGLRQAVSEQKRQMEDLDRTAAKLVSRYDELGSQIKSLKGAGSWDPTVGAVLPGLQQQRAGVLSQHNDLMVQRAESQRRLQTMLAEGRAAGMLPELPDATEHAQYLGGSNIPGPWARAKGWWQSRGAGMARSGLRIGGLALAGANSALNETLAGSTGFAALGAARNAAVDPLFNRYMAGDIMPLLAMKLAGGDGSKDLLGASTSTAAQIQVAKTQAIQAAGAATGLGGLFGGKTGPGGAGGAFTTANGQTLAAEQALKQAQAQEAATSPLTRFAVQGFQGNLGSRVQAGRIMGVGLRQRIDPQTGKSLGYFDTYGDLESKLMKGGYSVQEYMGARMQMRGLAGEQFSRGSAYEAMRASALGYGGYSELMGLGARTGTGRGFARTAIGGGIDTSAGIALGQTIMGSGWDARGTTNGMGVLGAAQTGFNWTGKAQDFQTAQRVGAGMAGLDAAVSGSLSPWQRGYNLVGAINRNPGASVLATDYLSQGMNFKQMADMAYGKSDLTATAKAFGWSRGDIKKQLLDSVSGTLQPLAGMATGDEPWAKSMRRWTESGKSLPDFLQSLGKGKDADRVRSDLGALWGQATGQGEEAGLGVMGLAFGLGGKGKQGSLKGGVGGVEGDALAAMSANAKKVADHLQSIAERVKESYQDLPTATTAAVNFAENLDGKIENFLVAIDKATAALNRLSGQPAQSPSSNDPGVIPGRVRFRR